jgi:GxxExxY protein
VGRAPPDRPRRRRRRAKNFTVMIFNHQDTKAPRLGNHFAPVSPELDRVAKEVVDAAFKVHSTLGPGLLESVYETCLAHDLKKRGLEIQTQLAFPIVYDDLCLDSGLRIDLLVENQLVVELKAVETMLPLFEAQLLTYLKLTNKRLGLLINFNVPKIKDGIQRIVL